MQFKLYGAIFGGLTVLFYLIGAFIAGSINCGDWNGFFKFCLAFFWLCHVWALGFGLPHIKKYFQRNSN